MFCCNYFSVTGQQWPRLITETFVPMARHLLDFRQLVRFVSAEFAPPNVHAYLYACCFSQFRGPTFARGQAKRAHLKSIKSNDN